MAVSFWIQMQCLALLLLTASVLLIRNVTCTQKYLSAGRNVSLRANSEVTSLAVRVATQYANNSLLSSPHRRPSASRATEQMQHSSTFPCQILPTLTAAAALCVKSMLSKAVKLDLLTLKVVS